jgi:hypothetical protein
MKKTRATALMLASVMLLTSAPVNALADDASVSSVSDNASVVESVSSGAAANLKAMALDGWVSGWTGAEDQAKNLSVVPTDDGVQMKTLKAGQGKFQSAEDSLAYYAYELPSTADFTLKGTITVNGFNSLGSSNPQQSSLGAFVFDDLYSKAAAVPKAYTNNVMLSMFLKSSSSTSAGLVPNYRYNGIKNIDIKDALVPNLPTSTANGDIGPFDIEIQKSGDTVRVAVNGEETSYNTKALATLDSQPFFSDTIYVGFYVSRDADITVSNVDFSAETRTVTGISVVKQPTKTTYTVGDTMDLTGLEVEAQYADGTSGLIEDYIVSGFDTDSKGERTMTLTKGDYTVEVPYTVTGTTCTAINVVTMPVYSEYYVGQRFSLDAFEAQAEYSNGLTSTLKNSECDFFIGDKKIGTDYYFTKDDIGEKVVTVKHAATDSIEASTVSDSFNITVEDYSLSGITIGNLPTVTTYAPNDELNSAGLTIRAKYTNDAGESRYALIGSDEYEILPVDTSELGTKTVTVRYLKDTSLTTTFNVTVSAKTAVAFQLSKYPRTTYAVGEDFTTDGMKATILYNNDDSEETAAYTVDLSKFDNTAVGTTQVSIVPDDTFFAPVTLDVTIVAPKTYNWHHVAFGASATATSNTSTVTQDENGNDVVNVRSWNGAGKITKDQDGMAYYYTSVDADNNFTISADILVNDYLEHDNTDSQRNGQEAFGIMARDVIPLTPDYSKYTEKELKAVETAKLADSSYVDMTTNPAKAKLDENGDPIPLNYKVAFSSNMAIAGGYSGNSWPDASAVNYEKYANINRINLVMRAGVTQSDGKGTSNIEKDGPYKLSSTFPARGNKYRVTLTRINGGLYASCYDYTTGETNETYQYAEDSEALTNLFTQQDSSTIYVGFFAARWADITVSNFELHETDPNTDPITNNSSDEATTPSLKLRSSAYTTTTDYNLSLRVSNKLGGYLTLQQNGKIVYRDEPISKNSILPVTLEPNSVNEFTALYTPNASDNITSTKDVTLKFTVTHKDKSTLGDYDVLYCSPDGTVAGDGTRENPLDIYSAVGFVDLGKTVIALDGTYKMTKAFSIPLTNTGVAKAWKTLRADDGATVTLDFQNQYEGMTLEGYYWHLKGIDFTNTGNNLKGFLLAGNHCLIEDCKFYANGDTGLQVSRNNDSNETIDTWPEYNVIRDCESYNNADPAGINADGFGLKLTVGYGNIFERCISHNNLDDGYDAYTKIGEGVIGPVTLDHCVSYDNGNKLNDDGTTTSFNAGGNNGFKMGGESVGVQHYMKNCISFNNGANGITTNTNPALKIRNTVSYGNSGCGFRLYTGSAKQSYDYDLKGCISYKNSSSDVIESQDISEYIAQSVVDEIPQVLVPYLTDEELAAFEARGGVIDTSAEYGNVWPIGVNHSRTSLDNATNYWDGKNCDGDVVTDAFFKSVDRNDSLSKGKYLQDEDGKFILGDYLALVSPVADEAEDIVNYPDGPQSVVDETTEATTAAATETTTKKVTSSDSSSSSSSSSSKGGSGSKKASSTAVETTTKRESSTEATTVAAKSFVTPSGVVITPPVSGGYRVSFSDIANRAWAVDSINKLASAGIVSGVSSDSFAPDAYSKRADFIVMLVRAFGLKGSSSDNFDDVSASKYYANALAIAKSTGIATGYGDGNFGPENTITRQDMMVLVAKALEFAGVELNTDESVLNSFADANAIASYAKPYVAALVNAGLANGTDNGIEPTALITRAQMSVLVANVYDLVLEMAENYNDTTEVETEDATEETSEEVTEETTEVEAE